jgi:hypothetical protein
MTGRAAWSGVILCLGVHTAHAMEMSNVSAKGKLTFIAGSGVDEIYRAEGWLKHKPSVSDLKLKLEQKNQRGLVKARVQLLPITIGRHNAGIAFCYQRKERANGETGLGVAVRFNGERWKWPIRYYPDLYLFHSKPVIRFGRLRADCQIIYNHDEDDGSLRPGMDWSLTNHFSVGFEGRAYSDPEKNYLCIRLSLSGKR